jgi:ribosomal protein L11 methyltransferase
MLRLALRVRRADAELVLAELLELAPSGVEEVDVSAETVEYAIYGPPGELPELPDLRAVAGDALVEISTREIADDWAERWREFHRPLVLGDRLVVRPPWEPPSGAKLDLVIDPGRAFGTGAHATTALCLELLLGLVLDPARPDAGRAQGRHRPESVIDVGCGSGVLAIAAGRLGFAPVTALDLDPLSIAATAENAQVNRVSLEVRRFDLRAEPVPAGGVVLANLLAPLLLALRLSEQTHTAIVSGLLTQEADRIARHFAAQGFREHARRARGEWVASLLHRRPEG